MIIIVCGVAGCGKSTIGREIANKLNYEFADADDFHSKENVELMRNGVGLNDSQRHGWLLALRDVCAKWHARQVGGVLACSALKSIYRHLLNSNVDFFKSDEENRAQILNLNIRFVLLDCSEELIRQRLACRVNHYFNPKLVQSQFSALERPSSSSRLDLAKALAFCEQHVAINESCHLMIVHECLKDTAIADQVGKIIADIEEINSLGFNQQQSEQTIPKNLVD